MFDQLLGGVQCHIYELIGRKEDEEVVQERYSIPLTTSRCKLTSNGSHREPLSEWMITIDVFLNTIMFLIFLTC